MSFVRARGIWHFATASLPPSHNHGSTFATRVPQTPLDALDAPEVTLTGNLARMRGTSERTPLPGWRSRGPWLITAAVDRATENGRWKRRDERTSRCPRQANLG